MAKQTSDQDGLAGVSFEQAVERIEALIEAIESGEVGLEKSIDEYERGMKLIGHCKGILDRAEQRIAKLTVTEDGGLVSDEAEGA